MNPLKKFAARLPASWQQELRRHRLHRAIRRGDFHAGEPEYDRLNEWISPGDWVLDVGANIGTYTLEMSRLVGQEGRVIAFEPIPETFSLLVSNVSYAACDNVTLINAAVSSKVALDQMSIPKFDSGLDNFYMARLGHSEGQSSPGIRQVLTLVLDNIGIEHQISLVKADTEGYEKYVLRGMWGLIQRDRPLLILETSSHLIHESLLDIGYQHEHIPGSPNRIYCM